ncbi:MAG: M48 family metallopeptidase [Rikenellaceae bacterium]
MQKSYIDRVLGAIILNESHRAKSISIRIKLDKITLTYPIGSNPDVAIKFLEQKRGQIEKIIQRKKVAQAENPPAKEYNEEQLRVAAQAHLPERIATIASQINIKYNRVTIRATRSKWGSCSGENNISLSIYLMILPQHLIDFVIIHELCHTIHHNHSAKFHALVDFICHGREKELNKELRRYSIR